MLSLTASLWPLCPAVGWAGSWCTEWRTGWRADVKGLWRFGIHLAEEPWRRGWKSQPVRSGWGLLFCLLWRNQGWMVTLWISVASSGDMERDMPLCSPRDPVPGAVGMRKLCQGRVRLGIRKYQEGGQTMSRSPQEVGDSPSLAVIEALTQRP